MWLFRKINVPVTWLTRRLAPRFIPDRHIGFLAFALVIVLRVLVYALFYRAGYIPSMSPTGPAPGSG
jgi:hypothetical protein